MQMSAAMFSERSTMSAHRVGVLDERARRGLRERTAGADGHHVVLGLDDVAVAGDHEQVLRVADQQQRFEAPQVAIAAPVLGELDGRASQIAELVELAFEALEQREGVGRAAGEAAEHLAIVERPHLARVALHDGVAESDLSVAADGDGAVAPHGQDGRAVRIEDFRSFQTFKTYVFRFARGWEAS